MLVSAVDASWRVQREINFKWTACRIVTKIRGEIAENVPYTGI